MRDNWHTCLILNTLELVPYRKKYVELYHEWMKDPYLQAMTASEPLTIEEEYEMQETWLNDPHKCTFLIRKVAVAADAITQDEAVPQPPSSELIGDINMFMHDSDDRSIAEIEVMIAVPAYWRKGYGHLALCMMMRYGVECLNITKFFAKISETNFSSIILFEKLGYKKVNYVAAFKEVEYELKCYTTDRTNAESNSTNPEKLVYSEPMMKILGVCQGWEHQKDFVQDITDEKE